MDISLCGAHPPPSDVLTQFLQMKERISKTTSNSTSTPLNSSSTEQSSGSEKENSEEELETPKTCPQVTILRC